MKIEDIQNFDLHITTKQGAEIINLINKLGIKDQVLDILGGGEDKEKTKLMMKLANKQNEFKKSLSKDIESKVSLEEYEEMEQEEQVKIVEETMSEKSKSLNKEINDLEREIQSYGMKSVLNLAYTTLIERYYPNSDLIEKTLANLFKLKVKEVQEQPLPSTFAMIKKLIESEDLKACINVFTGALH
ncbi:hypothetical protein G6Z15_13955 [Clostridium perfringens]|uniref:hypothetical protein n=1 Tax=Clostridium perfringens TaxID=1502 RepID=UPI0013E31E0B|nr:hypothetical protein [Clostridium perfringens]NGT58935.1 hypothetical protein [Clostridium perfringens]